MQAHAPTFRAGVLFLVMALLAVSSSLPVEAQAPLTLPQAVSIALEKNPIRKAALADERAAAAGIREARSGLLPRIVFSESATRGNDAVYAFGTRLRQGRFTAADFALNRLNHPTPIGDFATRFGGQWTLFDSFANVLNMRRAQKMQQAAAQQLERSDQETVFRVISAYYGLLFAAKQEQLADQELKTAQAILENSRNRFQSGLVVESDYLSSQVNYASRQQQLIQAHNGVALARVQVNNALGVPADSAYTLSEMLSEKAFPPMALEDIEKRALETRPDLKRVVMEEAAQADGVKLAKAAFGPRLNAFGSWGLDNPTFLGGGGSNNWTAGAELQLDLFSGGEKKARLSREKALQEKAAALRQAYTDGVRLDVRKAFYDHDAARQMLDVTRASVAQAEESLRINQNRYNGGLTTITDLLRAEEATRKVRTDYWQSVYQYQVTYANLELESGTLNAQSPVVTQ
ncbi:MAG TPA: TolC family protein [Terriglobales bacterium]|nr:TolC family protein [Terriglobales bacterium]